ncbi:MAG: hypothetical protein HQM14_16635 [SAR324 cluster bacterium]|nr:hypothetical protein [SAR324 cluster bacterium]
MPDEDDLRPSSRLFRKACLFYSFLEGGELGMLQKLVQDTNLTQQRLNEIFDSEQDEEEEAIEPVEMEAIAEIIGIPVRQLLWNQEQMNQLYAEFDLDFDTELKDINKRFFNTSINPLQCSRSVMAIIFSEDGVDPKEQQYFEYLKQTLSLTDEIIVPMDDSEKHFHSLIKSLPKDKRFLSVVVKWIIGAVFADGKVSEKKVEKLNELLQEIQQIRGELPEANVNLKPTI